MTFSFIEQMQGVRDLTAVLACDFGVPTIRTLVIRKRVKMPGQTQIVTSFVEITPTPAIDFVGPRLAGAFQAANITLEMDDFQVSGVSCVYARNDLVDTGLSYFVDGVLSPDGTQILSGIECDFISITQDTLCWKLVLRRKPDHR